MFFLIVIIIIIISLLLHHHHHQHHFIIITITIVIAIILTRPINTMYSRLPPVTVKNSYQWSTSMVGHLQYSQRHRMSPLKPQTNTPHWSWWLLSFFNLPFQSMSPCLLFFYLLIFILLHLRFTMFHLHLIFISLHLISSSFHLRFILFHFVSLHVRPVRFCLSASFNLMSFHFVSFHVVFHSIPIQLFSPYLLTSFLLLSFLHSLYSWPLSISF